MAPAKPERGSHSSGTTLARRLTQPTRMTGPETGWRRLRAPRHPYSVLLPVGFTVPSLLPETRWALTPPFHPYPLEAGGLLSVALSLGSPPPDVIRHRVSVEPGLSSPHRLSALVKRGCPANWHGLLNREPRGLPQKFALLLAGIKRRSASARPRNPQRRDRLRASIARRGARAHPSTWRQRNCHRSRRRCVARR